MINIVKQKQKEEKKRGNRVLKLGLVFSWVFYAIFIDFCLGWWGLVGLCAYTKIKCKQYLEQKLDLYERLQIISNKIIPTKTTN
jgi:hypothetical protein